MNTRIFGYLFLLVWKFKETYEINQPFKLKQKFTINQKQIPILAKITPIDLGNGRQERTFSAYVYLESKSSASYPYYRIICQTESSSKAHKIFSKFLNASKTDSKNYAVNNNKSIPKINVEHQKSGMWNNQSNIFQCEGTKCPETASSCKVLEYAVEPKFEIIKKTVLCLNVDEIVKREETESKNPKKGSSLNASRTYEKNEFNEKFETEMKKFEKDMTSTFGKFPFF